MKGLVHNRERLSRTRSSELALVTLMALPVVLLMLDGATGQAVRLAPLMVAVPALAAAFISPVGVMAVTAVAVLCVFLETKEHLLVGWTDFSVELAVLLLVSVTAMGTSQIRGRREQELVSTRTGAEVMQRSLLQPVPSHLGDLSLASIYVPADKAAGVGGDIYGVADLGERVRILIADAHNKGLAGIETMSYVLNAFRRSARQFDSLCSMVANFKEDVTGDLRNSTAAQPDSLITSLALEEFVTAVVVEIPERGDGPILMANLGHLPPLLIDHGRVVPLEPTSPMPPLGLSDLGNGRLHLDEASFPAGATLLLYTDSVVEARNRAGDFYPLAERLPAWARLAPGALVEAVRSDLRRYVGRSLGDDVIMVAVRRNCLPDTEPFPSSL
ncbi:PP2C family protein-serine/threonine phosphatase [Streptomyces nodosus]